MVTLVVPGVDAWYRHFKEKGVETINEPHDVDDLHLRAFLLRDPAGYVIEIQRFSVGAPLKPNNSRLITILKTKPYSQPRLF